MRAAHGAASQRGGGRGLHPPGPGGDPLRSSPLPHGPAGLVRRARGHPGPFGGRDDRHCALRILAGADRARAAAPQTGRTAGRGGGGEPVNVEQLPAKSLVLNQPGAGECIGSDMIDGADISQFNGPMSSVDCAHDIDGDGGDHECVAKPGVCMRASIISLASMTANQARAWD